MIATAPCRLAGTPKRLAQRVSTYVVRRLGELKKVSFVELSILPTARS